MKLVMYQTGSGQVRFGALRNADVIDLQSIANNTIEFLKGGATTLRAAEEAVRNATTAYPLDRVRLSPPLVPGKIFCLGLNYRLHALEGGSPIPEKPVIFAKYNNTIIGPNDPIVLPRAAPDRVDYEVELAFVIGKRCKEVPASRALEYVGGYTCAQDVSARDVQFWTSQWTLGKTPDTFCPLGPALVTADEIPDPQTLRLQTLLNGQIMQDSNTSDMVFRVADIIECLSSLITLEVGDTVLTGTPQGVGAARKPPIFLRPGDVLETRIYKLGSMRNPVVAASHLSDAPSGLTGSAELRVDGSR